MIISHLERVRGVPPLRADHPGEAEGGGAAVGQHGLQHLGGQQGGHRDTEAWSPRGLVMVRCRVQQGRGTHYIITSQAHRTEIT